MILETFIIISKRYIKGSYYVGKQRNSSGLIIFGVKTVILDYQGAADCAARVPDVQ